MAFKKTSKPTFSSRVSVMMPNDKGGHDKSQFDAVFKMIGGNDELEALRNKLPRDAMEAVLVGWREFLEEDGTPVNFNEAEVQALLSIPQALYGVMEAFWGNVIKASIKN